MDKVRKDQIFAIGSIILAIYLGYEAFGYPAKSSFFPRVLSVLMGFLGTVMLVRVQIKSSRLRSLKTAHETCEAVGFSSEAQALKMAVFVFGSIIAYGLLMEFINYEAATVVFLAGIISLLGFRRPFWLAGISVLLMVLLYGIFFELLGVPRPDSLLMY